MAVLSPVMGIVVSMKLIAVAVHTISIDKFVLCDSGYDILQLTVFNFNISIVSFNWSQTGCVPRIITNRHFLHTPSVS